MAKLHLHCFHCIFLAVCVALLSILLAEEDRQLHIIYMGARTHKQYSSSSYHINMLQEVVDSRQSLVRSYTRSFNAFAAYLTNEETQKLARFENVVSIFPSRILHPQTTRSWDFMGFSESVHRNLTSESDVIIGVIDSGIWPESESFHDEGFGPVPEKWRGVCMGGKNFTCNKKLIGARYYNSMAKTDDSARDTLGHGSHTASIAAGNNVKDASFYGIGRGTARGGVPSARIAAYKACHPDVGCHETDILAAFDDAIADGVDIITISVGGDIVDLSYDAIAIGAFHAMQKGVLTVHSAGNNGFLPGSVASVAPWLLTVAASNIDRQIISKVALGNGQVIEGNAVNSFTSNGTKFPLINGKDASSICSEINAKSCASGCLNSSLVKGKIVVCDTYTGINEALNVGAFGSIAQSGIMNDVSFVVPLPASALSSQKNSMLVQTYIESTEMPVAEIHASECIELHNAPTVASFSSKGPNTIIPDILKPDVTAPGVDILAAFPPVVGPSEQSLDKRSVKYNILSGTSMACPHVAGAAAYVKTLHPNWSMSTIKSALMTTAWSMNSTTNAGAEFSYGAGHIDPVKAAHPGLVYDLVEDDYAKMLHNMGYDLSTLRKIFGNNVSIPNGDGIAPKDLNYPSMTANLNGSTAFSVKFTRTVTNVGLANSRYKAMISHTSYYHIKVEPDILSFEKINERKSFVVTVSGESNGSLTSASLELSDGIHSVRSPILLYEGSTFNT